MAKTDGEQLMSNGEMQSLLNSEKTIKNEAKMKSIHSHLEKQMRTLVDQVADGLGSEVFRSRRIMSGR
jgi:hypothetical protein